MTDDRFSRESQLRYYKELKKGNKVWVAAHPFWDDKDGDGRETVFEAVITETPEEARKNWGLDGVGFLLNSIGVVAYITAGDVPLGAYPTREMAQQARWEWERCRKETTK